MRMDRDAKHLFSFAHQVSVSLNSSDQTEREGAYDICIKVMSGTQFEGLYHLETNRHREWLQNANLKKKQNVTFVTSLSLVLKNT